MMSARATETQSAMVVVAIQVFNVSGTLSLILWHFSQAPGSQPQVPCTTAAHGT
jgi:hypothetical protein